jgi:hypothetical protein
MRKYEIEEHTSASTSKKGIDANRFAKTNLLLIAVLRLLAIS